MFNGLKPFIHQYLRRTVYYTVKILQAVFNLYFAGYCIYLHSILLYFSLKKKLKKMLKSSA
jgi:hypothetical protein